MRKQVVDYIDGCTVTIYEKSVKNEAESERQGVPVYDAMPYVRIKPTNSKDTFDQPLNGEKKQRYADLYAKYESGEAVAVSGWPVEEWPVLDVTQVTTLKSVGILTVQMLAEMPESGMHRLPAGYITLKEKAQKALSERHSGERLREELEAASMTLQEQIKEVVGQQQILTDELAATKSELKSVKAALDKLKPKRGRPAKEKPAEA